MARPLRLAVESLAFGGDGVARHPGSGPEAGKVVFVAGALPGEVVLARLKERRRDFDRAETVKIIDSSPDRVEPTCPAFGRCGGCQLQHLAYPAQAALKELWLREKLTRLGIDDSVIEPIIASPQSYRYRYRARVAVTAEGRVGFRGARSHRPVAVGHCPVLTEAADELLGRLGRSLAARPPGRELEAQIAAGRGPGGEASASVVFTAWPGGGRLERALAERLLGLEAELGAAVYLGRPETTGDATVPDRPPAGSLTLSAAGLEMALFPGVFGQAQSEQNRNLTATVLAAARVGAGSRVLDLMAGMGNLSLPLAKAGAEVRAVEINPLAAANGRFNAARAGLEVAFEAIDAGKAIAGALPRDERYDLVVVDPPRQGIRELIGPLAELGTRRIIYVSCHPASLARDAAGLLDRGYALAASTPLDLFPQTFHLESVNLLVKYQ